MALIFMDGFDAYGSTNGVAPSGISRKWSTPNAVTVQAGRLTGKAIRFAEATNAFLSTNTANNATMIVACAMRINAHTDGHTPRLIDFVEGANLGLNLRLTATREFEIFKNATTFAGPTAGEAPAIGEWFFVELKVTTHNSAGAYELRVNGQTLLSGSSVNTRTGSNDYSNTIRIGAVGTGSTQVDIDDLYILDTSGAANNNFLGNLKIETLFPTTDDTVSCTPSTGAVNADVVDENPANDDTDYVDGGDTDQDMYNYDPTTALADIYGVMVNTVCRETDATNFDIQQVAESGGIEGTSTAEVIGSTSYVTRKAIFENNPDTAAPWTASEVDAATFGFKLAAS